MELRQLRHFVAAVRTGTINGAAAELHLSQPALTRSIQKLEKQLGVELLERRAIGVVATEIGTAVYARAEVILAEAERATAEIAARRAGGKGNASIGVGPSITEYLMNPAASAILHKYPRMTLKIEEGLVETLYPSLRSGAIDVIFSQFAAYGGEADLDYEPLVEIRSPILCRAEHPLARGTVTRQQLSATGWVLLEQAHVRRFQDAFFKRHKLPYPPYRILTNSLTVLRGMLLTTDLVALLPLHMVAEDIAAKRLVRVPYRTGTLAGSAGLIWMRDRPPNASVRAAADEIRTVCRRARVSLSSLYVKLEVPGEPG